MRSFRYAVAAGIAAVAVLFTISAPAPAQTAASPLSAARYTAFDQGYTFEIALDRDVTTPRLDNLEAPLRDPRRGRPAAERPARGLPAVGEGLRGDCRVRRL